LKRLKLFLTKLVLLVIMKTLNTTEKIAKRLIVGDRVLSASGKKLLVSLVVQKENRTIVMFDGDMEVDFDPYMRLKIIE
jgi:hypothetical protein